MKKLLFILSLLVMTLTVAAVPARRGVVKTLKLADGTEVKAQLVGDEHGHYWKGADGKAYRKADADFYQVVDEKTIINKAKMNRQKQNVKRAQRLPRRVGAVNNYTGKKKAIIILVNFANKSFRAANNKAYFERVANEAGFSDGKFKGSMADYFKDQSRGQFVLDFDVAGPYTVKKNYAYYGGNDSDGNDLHPAEMVIEAVKQANEDIEDWSDYDWDNDGYVDQVYVVYAGYGEADYNDENTIWPHAYTLEEGKEYNDGTGAVSVNGGKKVDTYACGPELNGVGGGIAGIGTMCHEFSHCLGYPDFYDIDYSGGQGMGPWDLMDSGSYNGDGYQPAGYTGYERWEAGWLEPITLEQEDVTVENMKSLQNDGDFYVIYNKRNRNEYFTLENRQQEGWDASLPAAGMLILHADYDANVWERNEPNNDPNHQRFTWIPADNKYQYEYYQGTKYYTEEGFMTDLFPYGSNNSFNKNTKPAAKLFNKNSDGTYYLNSSVENIKQNNDKTMSFKFVAQYDGSGDDPNGDDPDVKPSIEGALFYESFDQCDGKGGNDDLWSAQIANAEFLTDNTGWTGNGKGANQCAKFGTSSVVGTATTPAFAADATVTLTFRAGAWDSKDDGTALNLSVQGGTIDPAAVTLERGSFKDYSATITTTGSGTVKITFTGDNNTKKGRFFLDEVLVKGDATDGISEKRVDNSPARIYTLDGRYVGTDFKTLGRGLYLVNGKKIMK